MKRSLKYYDRQGQQIDRAEWVRRFKDFAYQPVDFSELSDGKVVSTVWIGIDESGREMGPMQIFETMVFPKKNDITVLDLRRYATEREARMGHDEMVKKWSAKVLLN